MFRATHGLGTGHWDSSSFQGKAGGPCPAVCVNTSSFPPDPQEMLKYSKSCEGAEDLQEALSSILGILKAVNDSMHLIAITGYDVRTAEGAPTFVPQLSGGANEPAWWGDLTHSGLGPAHHQCRATPLSFHVRACHLESIKTQSDSRGWGRPARGLANG